MSREPKERKILCFLLGIVVGSKILPWFIHLGYIAVITALVVMLH